MWFTSPFSNSSEASAWHTLVQALVVAVAAWYTLRLTIVLVLGRLLHGRIHVGRVGWFSLNDIEWNLSKHTPSSRIARWQSVKIDRIGWTIRTGSTREHDGTTNSSGGGNGLLWTGVSVSGVTITMALQACRDLSSRDRDQTRHPDGSSDANADHHGQHIDAGATVRRPDSTRHSRKRPSALYRAASRLRRTVTFLHELRRYLRRQIISSLPASVKRWGIRTFRTLRRYTVSPVLARMDRAARQLYVLSSLFAVEIKEVCILVPELEAHVDVDRLRLGLEIVRSHASFCGVWFRLDGLQAALDPADVPGSASKARPRGTDSVVRMPGSVTFQAKAPFDPSLGLSALYRRNALGKIELREHILEVDLISRGPHSEADDRVHPQTAVFVDGLLKLKERLARCPLRSSLERGYAPQEAEPSYSSDTSRIGSRQILRAETSPQESRGHAHPLAILKSFKIQMPHVAAESEIGQPDSKDTLYSTQARLKGFSVHLKLAETAWPNEKHTEWFGRQAALKWSLQTGFESLEIDLLATIGDRANAGATTSRLLDVAPTGFHVSSTWLPHHLEQILVPGSVSTGRSMASNLLPDTLFADDRSARRMVVEGDVGGLHGEASADAIDDLLRIPALIVLAGDKRSNLHTLRHQQSLPHLAHGSMRITDPPAISLAIELGQSEFRLLGPSTPHATVFGPGQDDGGSGVAWQSPSIIGFSVPSGSLYVSTHYVDVALKRTDAQQRDFEYSFKRGKVSVPESLQASLEERHKILFNSGRRPRASLIDESNVSVSVDSETMSPSASPSASPAPEAARAGHESDSTSDEDAPFILPGRARGRRSRKSPVSNNHTEDDAQGVGEEGEEEKPHAHSFVYHISARGMVSRGNLFLISQSDRIPGRPDVKAESVSVGTQRSAAASRRQRGGDARRASPPLYQARYDILSIGPVDISADAEILGHDVHQPSRHRAGPAAGCALLDLRRKHVNARIQLDSLMADISKLDVLHALNGTIAIWSCAMLARRQARQHAEEGGSEGQATPVGAPEWPASSATKRAYRPLVTLFPSDVFLLFSINDVDVHLAGPDAKFSSETCRGVAIQAQNIVIEGVKQTRALKGLASAYRRARLGLRDDLRGHSQAHFVANPDGQAAYLRMLLTKVAVNPLKSSGQSNRIMRAKAIPDSTPHPDHNVNPYNEWELINRDKLSDRASPHSQGRKPAHTDHSKIKDSVHLPSVTLRVSIWEEKDSAIHGHKPRPPSSPVNADSASQGDNAKTDAPSQETASSSTSGFRDHVGLSIFAPSVVTRIDVFQIYCILSALSALRSLKPRYAVPPAPPLHAEKPSTARPAPRLELMVKFPDQHIYLTLPHDVKLYLHLVRLRVDNPKPRDVRFRIGNALMAGASIPAPGLWDDILRFRDLDISYQHEPGNAGYRDHTVKISGAGARLRLPFKYPFSMIIDNAATFVKTIKQLVHQFVKGKYNLAIEPHAEEAKRLPFISVALKILVLEAQDDPFETKLNLIWRAGVDEQGERLSREQAFEDKLALLRAQRAEAGLPQDQEADRDAYAVLQSIHSTKWIKRFRNAMETKARREERQFRRLYGGLGSKSSDFKDSLLPVRLVSTANTAPLLRWVMENPLVEISKPTFANNPDGLVDFLADVGKGVPRDTQYTLLVPCHLRWQMSEARIHLRDYPLPLVYIPPVQQMNSDATSWQMTTDFVLAEEVGGPGGIRYVSSVIVPREMASGPGNLPYALRVPRTAMPVKTFALPVITITSAWATRFGWGNSIQPCIQDVMRVLDTLTKAPPDPSEKMGFWDKLRLILHWRITVNFKGEGPLHFILKGSRDPYSLHGPGAGFALCWSGNICWTMGFPNDVGEFFQIKSDNFVLGVPDLKDYVDAAATGVIKESPNSVDSDERSQTSGAWTEASQARAYRRDQSFEKVCAKFLGGVQWGLGLKMERTCRDHECPRTPKCSGPHIDRQCRFFTFRPHYTVQTISGADHPHEPHHDSFAGFRSDFIHFSVSVVADDPDSPANTIHLTPNGFTHFWAWWHLFDGTMSLPVRHGSLFPTVTAPSKKFGKHCATIKYRCQLAPVMIAHTYRQDDWDDWRRGRSISLGVKGRMGRFNVDLHQREQEESVYSEHLGRTRKRLHKAFFRAEVDCVDMDVRVLSARFEDPYKSYIDPAMEAEEDDNLADPLGLDDAATVPDEDLAWVDLDDYYDLYRNLPDQNPKMRIRRFFRSPRFTYSRYAQPDVFDHPADGDSASEVEEKAPVSKFGSEPSHFCLLNRAADAIDVQLEAMQARVDELREELAEKARASSRNTVEEVEQVEKQLSAAERGLQRFMAYRDRRRSAKTEGGPSLSEQQKHYNDVLRNQEHIQDFGVFDDLDTWINRLIIHNPKVVITQQIRDILLRYHYSSRSKRLLDYAMTARAIKFIKDLSEETGSQELRKEKKSRNRRRQPPISRETSSKGPAQTGKIHEDLFDKLLNDKGLNWSFKDQGSGTNKQSDQRSESGSSSTSQSAFDLDPQSEGFKDLPDHWGLRNSYIVSLLKPQIAFNSEGSESQTVILTSMSVQLRVFKIVDELHVDDPINSHVMYRSFGAVDSLQAFYPHVHGWRSGKKEYILNSLQFVPLEVLAGCADDPADLDRIVPRTSAKLRYDKYNRLRLLNDGKASGSHHGRPHSVGATLDRLSVECERFSVSATPRHYGAIYDVVTNLLLYSDPGQKAKSQKVERIVLSKDFSDKHDIAMAVSRQQDELRMVRRRLIGAFDRGMHTLAEPEIEEHYLVSADYIRRSEIISMWMRAIQTAQDNRVSNKSMGMQIDAQASEIVWHMREAGGTPLAKVGVKGIAFRWLNRNDGSVSNCLLISDLVALNSSPEHYFSEIIAKYPVPPSANEHVMREDLFMAVVWSMLTPVGGINIVERFEVHLHPVRLQIEQWFGKKILDYVFSQREARKKQAANGETSLTPSSSTTNIRSSSTSVSSRAARSVESLSVYSGRRSGEAALNDDHRSFQHRSSSNGSFVSTGGSSISTGLRPASLMHVSSSETLALAGTKPDDHLDAEEMRERARMNRAFLHVEVFPTILCLSFRGDKHSTVPDLYGLIYKSPTIIHCNRLWTYLDLIEHLKRDFKSSIWSQSATLLGQILTTARRPKNAVAERLLGKTDRDNKDRSSGSKRHRSISSSIRARITSNSGSSEAHKVSPLRSSMVRRESAPREQLDDSLEPDRREGDGSDRNDDQLVGNLSAEEEEETFDDLRQEGQEGHELRQSLSASSSRKSIIENRLLKLSSRQSVH